MLTQPIAFAVPSFLQIVLFLKRAKSLADPHAPIDLRERGLQDAPPPSQKFVELAARFLSDDSLRAWSGWPSVTDALRDEEHQGDYVVIDERTLEDEPPRVRAEFLRLIKAVADGEVTPADLTAA